MPRPHDGPSAVTDACTGIVGLIHIFGCNLVGRDSARKHEHVDIEKLDDLGFGLFAKQRLQSIVGALLMDTFRNKLNIAMTNQGPREDGLLPSKLFKKNV